MNITNTSYRNTRFFATLSFLICVALLYNLLVPVDLRVYVIPTINLVVLFLFSLTLTLAFYAAWFKAGWDRSDNQRHEHELEVHRLTYENKHINEKHASLANMVNAAFKKKPDTKPDTETPVVDINAKKDAK